MSPDVEDKRVYKKYSNIRIFQHQNNRPKLSFKFPKPIHLNFTIDFDSKLIDTLNKKLDLVNNMRDPKKPPLFHMRSSDPKSQMTYHDMQLTRIIVKCQDCDFEQRVTKVNIEKNMRLHKNINLERSKQHVSDTSHKVIVQNTFEQWKQR